MRSLLGSIAESMLSVRWRPTRWKGPVMVTRVQDVSPGASSISESSTLKRSRPSGSHKRKTTRTVVFPLFVMLA